MAGVRSKDLSCKNKLGHPRLFSSLSQQVELSMFMATRYPGHALRVLCKTTVCIKISHSHSLITAARYVAVGKIGFAGEFRWLGASSQCQAGTALFWFHIY